LSTGLNVADEFLFFAEEIKYQLVSYKTGKCNNKLPGNNTQIHT